MTRARHKATGRLAHSVVLPALVFAAAAQGQTPGSVQDYHLPPATKPTPTAAGPVDTDHPVAAPTRPAPAPTATPSPVIRLPRVAATPRAASPSATPTPRAERKEDAEARPKPRATPTVASPAPTQSTAPVAAPPAIVSPAPPPVALPAPQPPAEQNSRWPWFAGGAAVVLAAGAFLFLRRRRTADNEVKVEAARAVPTSTLPEPSPPAALKPPAKAPPAASPPPPPPTVAPPLAASSRPLEMQLEARHLSRALVNATLAYRLTLTNRSEVSLGPLRIAGDIISAHASLAPQDQLTPPDEALATIHQVAALTPGDSVTLSGELRLPIASILPISAGAARVFVPLARFRVEPQDGPAAMRVFVVGQASEQPGGALRPFPLDRGPGVDRALGQRELELPA